MENQVEKVFYIGFDGNLDWMMRLFNYLGLHVSYLNLDLTHPELIDWHKGCFL